MWSKLFGNTIEIAKDLPLTRLLLLLLKAIPDPILFLQCQERLQFLFAISV